MVPSGEEWECRNPKCGTKKKIEEKDEMSVRVRREGEEKGMLVVERKEDTLPKTQVECPKCGNNEAYWVIRQMRAADEPETKLLRCTKCSHTWRD